MSTTRAGEPYEPPDEPYNESRDPEDLQVDPGGDTDVKINESVAPASADTVIDGEVAGTYELRRLRGSVETHQEAAIEAGGRSATAHGRSTTRAKEGGQRTLTGGDDVPRMSHQTPPLVQA
jgi:hypothetical protein